MGSPDDTAMYTPPGVTTASGASNGGEKSGTSFDTIVGRMVVEQKLATADEVRHCVEQAKSDDASDRSLAELLVSNDYITKRQLTRLRELAEAERSSQQIPGYQLKGKLGAGAMATVYKAKQLELDRTVAVKILPRKHSANPQFIQRFYDEGRAAASLNHPNIVQAIHIGNVGDLYYFVMEYVDGRTVHDDIVANKRFAEAEAIEVAIQVAEALDHAHERGLIHRDVKPTNVLVADDGHLLLSDFGLAVCDAKFLTGDKTFVGTLDYLS
ncbi:MAG: serine/threonine-protein kinase, partial [Planctomycetota bacterium]